jgi:phage terminase small subunit
MPRGGHNAKPPEIRKREGNPGHRPLPEPLLVAGRPDLQAFATPPATLDRDATEFWRDSVTLLIEAGVVDLVDKPSLMIGATIYARVLQCQRLIAERGLFSPGSTGQIREAPWVKLERDSMVTFMRWAESHALTPVARTRLGLAQLHGKAMAKELEDALGPDRQADVESTAIEAEIIEDGDTSGDGLPGL